MKTLRILTLISVSSVLLAGCNIFSPDTTTSGNGSNNTAQPTNNSEPTSSTTIVMPEVIETKTRLESDTGDYYKDIWYAPEDTRIITNTYKVGGDNYQNDFNVNNGEDYYWNTKTSDNYAKIKNNLYDLMIPDTVKKDEENTILLCVHGGSWVAGDKSDIDYISEPFAENGFITASMNYTVLAPDLSSLGFAPTKGQSIYRMLDEIDACISHIKYKLGSLGFDESKLSLAIAGVSAGSHISMLYAYSRGDKSAIPLKFIVNTVGPVDITPDCWLAFTNPSDEVLDAGIEHSAIEAQKAENNIEQLVTEFKYGEYISIELGWNQYRTISYVNAMAGAPYTSSQVKSIAINNETDIDRDSDIAKDLLEHYVKTVSVTNYVNDKYPIISAYGGKDNIVGIGQYATLEPVLVERGVEHEFVYFKNSNHDLANDSDKYAEFIGKIVDWLTTK